ncbi:hypothetical protein [Dongshaea marina]|uniref:hypothetical protein n=1 Tax=Dongshaea marina TaxID=2047966 RepID=UPI000D3E20AE|nr:hypothetical protein [Dongshaea marina]
MRKLLLSSLISTACALPFSAAHADTTKTLTLTPATDCSEYYCTYSAKVTDPSPLWNYTLTLDNPVLPQGETINNDPWTDSDMVKVGVNSAQPNKSWKPLTVQVVFNGSTPQPDPGPAPGPTPTPTPASGDNSFTIDLSDLNLSGDLSQAKVIIVPQDAAGNPLKNQAGEPIVFNTTADQVSGTSYLCADWNQHTLKLQQTTDSCTDLQWFNEISGQPASVSVRMLNLTDDKGQTTVSLYGQSKGEMGSTFKLAPEGEVTQVSFTASDQSSSPSASNTEFYNLEYTDKSTQVSLDFPLALTLAPTQMLNISVPSTSVGEYQLIDGVSVTGFKDASISDPVINAQHIQARTITITDHQVPEQVNLKNGWPEDRVAMGSVTDFSNNDLLMKRSNVDAVFKYADNDGAGDRTADPKQTWSAGHEGSTATARTVELTQQLSKAYGHPVVPVLVEYTVQSSGGATSGTEDLTNDLYLRNHYENLLLMARYLENHPDPNFKDSYGTLVLNPDFLGEVFKDDAYINVKPNVRAQLEAAIKDLYQSQMITDAEYQKYMQLPEQSEIPNTLTGFVKSTNWLLNQVAPHVAFGWSLNIWAGDDAGHNWVHGAYNDPAAVQRHVNNQGGEQCQIDQPGINLNCGEVPFLESVGAYNNENPIFNPTFVAFDKYERDTLLSTGGVNNPYLYNANDWSVYVQYVGEVSKGLHDMPVMLFQIPGGHMTGKNQQASGNEGATAVDYFLGNPSMANHKLEDIIDTNVPYQSGLGVAVTTDYKFPVANATYMDYLSASPKVISSDNYQATKNGYYDWGQNHMNDLRRANVFSVLWGGGSTISIAGPGANDDGGYLNQQIGNYLNQLNQ